MDFLYQLQVTDLLLCFHYFIYLFQFIYELNQAPIKDTVGSFTVVKNFMEEEVGIMAALVVDQEGGGMDFKLWVKNFKYLLPMAIVGLNGHNNRNLYSFIDFNFNLMIIIKVFLDCHQYLIFYLYPF